MKKTLLLFLLSVSYAASAQPIDRNKLIARAAALKLKTGLPYKAPQDGVWNGERILPEGFTKFVSTLAPAWIADGRPIHGGLFWINGDGA